LHLVSFLMAASAAAHGLDAAHQRFLGTSLNIQSMLSSVGGVEAHNQQSCGPIQLGAFVQLHWSQLKLSNISWLLELACSGKVLREVDHAQPERRAMRKWISLAALVAGLGFLPSGPAVAASAGAFTTGLKAAAPSPSVVDQVARRCWRHRGHWHCERRVVRYHYYDDYYSPYYSYSPGYYGYGPGYGPGINFFFGGGRGHHHHHRHR
jgi:hypothetical protein